MKSLVPAGGSFGVGWSTASELQAHSRVSSLPFASPTRQQAPSECAGPSSTSPLPSGPFQEATASLLAGADKATLASRKCLLTCLPIANDPSFLSLGMKVQKP